MSAGLLEILDYLKEVTMSGEEAIPERDPLYRLPIDSDTLVEVPWDDPARQTWEWMLAQRPLLASLLVDYDKESL